MEPRMPRVGETPQPSDRTRPGLPLVQVGKTIFNPNAVQSVSLPVLPGEPIRIYLNSGKEHCFYEENAIEALGHFFEGVSWDLLGFQEKHLAKPQES